MFTHLKNVNFGRFDCTELRNVQFFRFNNPMLSHTFYSEPTEDLLLLNCDFRVQALRLLHYPVFIT